MFAFLKPIAAVAAVIGGLAYGAAHIGHPGNSVSAGMQPGPVCITQTAHPGNSYSAPVSAIGNGNLSLSVEQTGNFSIYNPAGPPYPAGGHPLPKSWVSFSGSTQVTVNVPQNAAPGRYGALLVATNTGSGGSGSGDQVALGAAAGTWLEVSVNTSPPPKAFCTGQRPTYWPWVPLKPVCKNGQTPLTANCRDLPPMPTVANAKNCHLAGEKASTAANAKAWADYRSQIHVAITNHDPGASMRDLHCIVNGQFLNTRAYYRSTHAYR